MMCHNIYVTKISNHDSTPTYLLREIYREGGKVKHSTLGNIISFGSEKIARISQILKGVALVPVHAAIQILHSRPHGHVEAILTAIYQLGLDHLIARKPFR
ncbi:MAG: hypothetical protein LBE12_00625 [Planctomycetaceae bacterium]|jgi:hypothetical protein|nr:hypothetical protein [Planctomycetaceae bacterium]